MRHRLRTLLIVVAVGALFPLAGVFLLAFGMYRASQIEYRARHGRTVAEWLQRAADPEVNLRNEAIGVLAETLSSIHDKGPMNCAGPDPFIWVERRKRDRFLAEVRPSVPEIVEVLARMVEDQSASCRVTAINGLSTVAIWSGADAFRQILPTLIHAAQDQSAEIRMAATDCIIWNFEFGFHGSNEYQQLPVDSLVPILTDPSLPPSKLGWGVTILGFIGSDASKALPRLKEIIKDGEQNQTLRNVAQHARWAINRIRGEPQ